MDDLDQLRESYAGMDEDELAAIAADAYDLTDLAKRVLSAEISRRGLKIELQTTAVKSDDKAEEGGSADEPELDQLEEVATVWNAEEARKLQKLFSDSGIPSYLGHDNVENVDSFHGSFDHGVDVKVAVDDMKTAIMLIESNPETAPAESKDAQSEDNAEDDEKDDGAQFVVRCPKCHSEGVVLDKRESEPGVEREFDQKVINGKMKVLRKGSDCERHLPH